VQHRGNARKWARSEDEQVLRDADGLTADDALLSHPRYLLDVLAGPTATAAHKNKERIRISLSLRRKIKTNPENRTEDEE
jgi:hypothetical protein